MRFWHVCPFWCVKRAKSPCGDAWWFTSTFIFQLLYFSPKTFLSFQSNKPITNIFFHRLQHLIISLCLNTKKISSKPNFPSLFFSSSPLMKRETCVPSDFFFNNRCIRTKYWKVYFLIRNQQFKIQLSYNLTILCVYTCVARAYVHFCKAFQSFFLLFRKDTREYVLILLNLKVD